MAGTSCPLSRAWGVGEGGGGHSVSALMGRREITRVCIPSSVQRTRDVWTPVLYLCRHPHRTAPRRRVLAGSGRGRGGVGGVSCLARAGPRGFWGWFPSSPGWARSESAGAGDSSACPGTFPGGPRSTPTSWSPGWTGPAAARCTASWTPPRSAEVLGGAPAAPGPGPDRRWETAAVCSAPLRGRAESGPGAAARSPRPGRRRSTGRRAGRLQEAGRRRGGCAPAPGGSAGWRWRRRSPCPTDSGRLDGTGRKG